MWSLHTLQRPALKGKFIFPVASSDQREMKRVQMVGWLLFLENPREVEQWGVPVGKWLLTLTAPTSNVCQFLSMEGIDLTYGPL